MMYILPYRLLNVQKERVFRTKQRLTTTDAAGLQTQQPVLT